MEALVRHINSPFPTTTTNDVIALHQSIDRLKGEVSKLNIKIKSIGQESANKRFLIPSNDGYKYISSEEIVYCEAEGNYTTIYLTNGSTCLVSKTLKKISDSLNTDTYIRCHQSYLINKKYISQIVNFNCEIKSENHKLWLPISRRKFSAVVSTLDTLF